LLHALQIDVVTTLCLVCILEVPLWVSGVYHSTGSEQSTVAGSLNVVTKVQVP